MDKIRKQTFSVELSENFISEIMGGCDTIHQTGGAIDKMVENTSNKIVEFGHNIKKLWSQN